MNRSRWTGIASFAAIWTAGITSLGACAGATESSTDSSKTALSSTDGTQTESTDVDASTSSAEKDGGCEGRKGTKE